MHHPIQYKGQAHCAADKGHYPHGIMKKDGTIAGNWTRHASPYVCPKASNTHWHCCDLSMSTVGMVNGGIPSKVRMPRVVMRTRSHAEPRVSSPVAPATAPAARADPTTPASCVIQMSHRRGAHVMANSMVRHRLMVPEHPIHISTLPFVNKDVMVFIVLCPRPKTVFCCSFTALSSASFPIATHTSTSIFGAYAHDAIVLGKPGIVSSTLSSRFR